MINEGLAISRGIPPHIQTIIEAVQEARDLIELGAYEEDECLRRRLAIAWTDLNYSLQSLWRFRRDSRYHRFWRLPGCICSKMDNEERYPSGIYVVNSDCPVHGYKAIGDMG